MKHCEIKAKRRNSSRLFIHLNTGNLFMKNLLKSIEIKSLLILVPFIAHYPPERFNQKDS